MHYHRLCCTLQNRALVCVCVCVCVCKPSSLSFSVEHRCMSIGYSGGVFQHIQHGLISESECVYFFILCVCECVHVCLCVGMCLSSRHNPMGQNCHSLRPSFFLSSHTFGTTNQRSLALYSCDSGPFVYVYWPVTSPCCDTS